MNMQNSHKMVNVRPPLAVAVNSGSPFLQRPVGKYHAANTRMEVKVCQNNSTMMFAETKTTHEYDFDLRSRASKRPRSLVKRGMICWSTVLKSWVKTKAEKKMFCTPCMSSLVMKNESPVQNACSLLVRRYRGLDVLSYHTSAERHFRIQIHRITPIFLKNPC